VRYRALFLGSNNIVPIATMRSWLGAGHEIASFWRPATPTGGAVRRDRRRAWILPRCSATAIAGKHGFPIRDVSRLATWPDAVDAARATGADVLISAFFRYVIPTGMLDLFGDRAVNFHPAPLPRFRGPAPIHAMVLDRSILTDGAMTIHVLAPGLDEGPIVAQEQLAFPADMTIHSYEIALAQASARMAAGVLPQFFDGDIKAVPQDEGAATYVRTMRHELDLSIDQTADEIRWRCATFAKSHPLKIVGIDDGLAIGFVSIVGPPSGLSPAIGPFTIDFDAADARVRVRRKLPFTRQFRTLRDFYKLAKASVD